MNKHLIEWSSKEYGHLPWRKRRSLYGTLVSEIMLQQTTVGTVLNHFDRFLNVYPDIFSLARASEEEVCSHWQGLGYYRRARNLRKAAVTIVEKHGGKFPRSLDELKEIPGIGVYTASALLAIGMNKPALAVDANLERVLSRLFLIKEEKGPKLQKKIQSLYSSGEIKIPFKKFSPRDVNEALMDLGRVYCQARKADCLLCPLKKSCQVYASSIVPTDIPVVTQEKKKESHELKLLRVIVQHGNKVLAYEKSESEWLSGQIEIPTFVLSCTDKSFKQYPKLKGKVSLKGEVLKSAITKYKIENEIIVLNKKEFQELMSESDVASRYKYYLRDGQKHHFSTTTLKCFKKISI